MNKLKDNIMAWAMIFAGCFMYYVIIWAVSLFTGFDEDDVFIIAVIAPSIAFYIYGAIADSFPPSYYSGSRTNTAGAGETAVAMMLLGIAGLIGKGIFTIIF